MSHEGQGAEVELGDEPEEVIQQLWNDVAELRVRHTERLLVEGKQPLQSKQIAEQVGIPSSSLSELLSCKHHKVPEWYAFSKIIRCLGGNPREWEPLWRTARTAYDRKLERLKREGGTRRTRSQPTTTEQPGSAAAIMRAQHGESVPDRASPLTAAADALADDVNKQWLRAAGHRHLLRPAPIPVRWCWSRRPATGPIEAAVGDRQAGPLFPPLPGAATTTANTLRAGGLHDIFNVYSGLGSGRIVILGSPGAGKSAVAILTVLAALNHRKALDHVRRAKAPVPVLLTAHGWDPRQQLFEDWLAQRLADDYPALQSSTDGRDLAIRLIENGQITLFLDGLDEMPAELRPVAVEAINRQATTIRVVVLTRSEEFIADARSKHIYGAAALELGPVSVSDAADYLQRCQTEPLPEPWQRLITHLREHPDSVVAAALDSPLNLTLVRDAFPDPNDIDALLLQDQFDTPEEVEDRLLDRVVPVAYQSVPGQRSGPYRPDEAHAALSYIATRMNARKIRDLAWWRMHHWAPASHRILAVGLLGLFVGALIGAVVFGPVGKYTVMGATGTLFGTAYGSGMGWVFGLLAAGVSEFRGHRPRPGHWLSRGPLNPSRFNLAVGLLLGLAAALAVGNQSHYVFGVPVGLLVGFTAGRAATRVQPSSAQANWERIRARVDLSRGCLAGLPIGLAYGFTKHLGYGLAAGAVSTIAFGLMIGFSRPPADADNATDPQASWRRDCRRAVSFGLAAGLPLGIALGIGNGVEEGLLSGAVAGIGFGALIGLGGMAAVSDAWRTTLLFLQLRRRGVPLLGMRFLKYAYDQEVLRIAGPIYQFRHARLQDRLASGGPVVSQDLVDHVH